MIGHTDILLVRAESYRLHAGDASASFAELDIDRLAVIAVGEQLAAFYMQAGLAQLEATAGAFSAGLELGYRLARRAAESS